MFIDRYDCLQAEGPSPYSQHVCDCSAELCDHVPPRFQPTCRDVCRPQYPVTMTAIADKTHGHPVLV